MRSTSNTKAAKIREAIFSAYLSNQIDQQSVMSRLDISKRQFFRLKHRFIESGSLAHGLCGRVSNHSIALETKARVLSLCQNKYRGWNYAHISSTLKDLDQISVSPDCIRNWLLAAKITLPRQRKPKKYIRREPRARFNEMLQLDGTFDDFLGDGRLLCLMHLVDDATKTSLALLCESESTGSALLLLYQWCLKFGVPESIYSDRHSVYKVNEKQRLTVEEELEGKTSRITGFGSVCNKLGIKQIFAYSPQAKGRVEKKHQLYKDRLIKEIRLYGLTTVEEVNTYLLRENGFVDKLNSQFTIEAREASSTQMFTDKIELAQQFTIDHTRTVRNDYTIQFRSVVYQLSKNSVINARSKVMIKEPLNQSISIYAGKHELEYKKLDNYVRVETPRKIATQTPKVRHKPEAVHPYRQYKPARADRSASGSNKLEKLGMYYS